MTAPQAHLHRAEDARHLRRAASAALHFALALALLASALTIAHATLTTALALPDLASAPIW